jgi:SAM-dependent methyltransferase
VSAYGKLCTEFYALDKPSAPPDAFDFYERYARAAGGPVHEPMCGSGRFLLPLLAQGIDITGSDTSLEMLRECQRRAGELGLEPRLLEQSLQKLAPPAPPRLLFIPSGSFGLLIDDSAVTAALAQVHEVLAPGGCFLVEVEKLVTAPPETSGTWGGRWVDRPDGAKLIISWLSQYSGAANITTSIHRYELVKDGQLQACEYEDFRVRSYAPSEFRERLQAAGFTDIEALSPFTDEPALEADDAIVFKCRKRGH